MRSETRKWTKRERWTVRSPRVERIDIIDQDDQIVASVLADDTEEVEDTILEVVSKRGKANADFLLAAPEMYEALRLVLALHDDPASRVPGYHRNLTEFAAPLLDPKAETQLRAALAKADDKRSTNERSPHDGRGVMPASR